MLTIKLPYPDMALSPNRKNGRAWQATKGAKVNQRYIAFIETKKTLAGAKFKRDGDIPLSITFMRDDKRTVDADNALSAFKSAIDGMCMALGIDDKQFNPVTILRAKGSEKCTIVCIE